MIIPENTFQVSSHLQLRCSQEQSFGFQSLPCTFLPQTCLLLFGTPSPLFWGRVSPKQSLPEAFVTLRAFPGSPVPLRPESKSVARKDDGWEPVSPLPVESAGRS